MTCKSLAAMFVAVVATTTFGQNALRPNAKPASQEPRPFPAEATPAEPTPADPEPVDPSEPQPAPKVKPAPAAKKVEPAPVDPVESSKEARLLLHEAAQVSQTAKTVEQLTDVVELCARATQKPLTAEEMKYGRDLHSWALNKRGEVYAGQASEFLAQGSEKESAKLDRQALEDFKASVKLDANRWKAIHNRGVSYGVLGLHEDALADFSRVVQLKPAYANGWFNRGEVHLELNRFAEAVLDYTHVIKLRPEDAAAYRQRARAYLKLNKVKEALADFDKAISLDVEDAVSLVQRGELRAEAGDYERAAADFRAAIDADPDCAEAYRGEAWLMATCPQVKLRNGKIAIELAEQGIQLATAQSKNDHTYYDVLAAAYANAGRFEEAQQTLQKAIPHAPIADAAAMKKRLALYAAGRPYRDAPAAVATKPAASKSQR